MTNEERIAQLESEVFALKEDMKRNRKANVWKKVKDKFSLELNSFNWVDIHETTRYDGKPITFKQNRLESYHIQQAIGTLIRIALKRKGLNYLEETDEEEATEMMKEILEIMKKRRNTNEK